MHETAYSGAMSNLPNWKIFRRSGGVVFRYEEQGTQRSRFASLDLLELQRLDWPAEEITLRFIAAALTQESLLLHGLHTFRDDAELQRPCEPNDGVNDTDVIDVRRNACDERAIDL